MTPLERLSFRRAYALSECVACGGSGVSSRGRSCLPCGSTGAQGGAAVLAELAGDIVTNPSSVNVEHYTPIEIVDAARLVLGGIDLDPASCPLGQDVVGAEVWYGPHSPFGEDGLVEPGAGRVFLNPPGGRVPESHAKLGTRSSAALWWGVWSSMWQAGEIETMIFVGFSMEILRSAQALDVPQPLDYPMCVPSARIAFDTVNIEIQRGKCAGQLIDPKKPEGSRVKGQSPPNANVIIWLPPEGADVEVFLKAFEKIGRCRV